MIGALRSKSCVVLMFVSGCGLACSLRRPDVQPARVIEPQLPEPSMKETSPSNAVPVRLLETQARGHIGRRLLHQQSNGELVEDTVWRWASTPDRYLDAALRAELASNSEVRLVDAGSAPALAATLVVWDLESAGETRLMGAVEFQITGSDRAVHTQVVRASEPVSAELPGNLAAPAGILLRCLASEGITRMVRRR
jgi:ABC-type transport auxiliary lipoprotein component